jgi:hypothetical protein
MTSLRAMRAAFAIVVCGVSATGFSSGQSAAQPEQGVWQRHEIRFQYFGFTTTYSCDGLAGKLRVLLIAAGARADAKSTAESCVRGFGAPDKLARVRLTFYALAPVGNGAAASPPVDGLWRPVMVADRSPRDVALGDCELIEQFRDKVLPMFTTRNIDNRMTCVPNQVSGSVINLKFEVFEAPPETKKK